MDNGRGSDQETRPFPQQSSHGVRFAGSAAQVTDYAAAAAAEKGITTDSPSYAYQHGAAEGFDSMPAMPPAEVEEPHAAMLDPDAHEWFPEGGLEAWLVVMGAWCAMFPTLGVLNSYAVFQEYVSAHQLADQSAGSIGWVFSLNSFICFLVGVFIGPAFDKYGPRWLVLVGSVLAVASLAVLSFCTILWHFILVLGLVNGIGMALLYTPSIAAVGHFFRARRGLATGIASTGGGFGGIVIPLMLESLFARVGWAWAMRILALVSLVLVVAANLLIKARLPPEPNASANPSVRIFRNGPFALATVGIFFAEFALMVPLTYVSAYAVSRGFSAAFALRLVAILNASSVVGRVLPGWYADRVGPFNANMIALAIAIASLLGLWLPFSLVDATRTSPSRGGDSNPTAVATLVVYAVCFGFTSGCNINLMPVCIGRLCPTVQYGRYYASCYTVVSFALLMGVPIAGNILTATGGEYWGLIAFTASLYAVALVMMYSAKGVLVGWNLTSRC